MIKKKQKKKINTWLKEDFSVKYGEIHYSSIKPRIIIEEYIENIDGEVVDYKYFCFNGRPYYIQYLEDRKATLLKSSFFDLNWVNQNFYNAGCCELDKEVKKPKNLETMNEIARKLSEEFKMVRVDLYNINGKIYFGELTFTPFGGYFHFTPNEWNLKLGECLNLFE